MAPPPKAHHALALEILGAWLAISGQMSFHLWLPQPEPWRTETFLA
ncbi:MAG TPA: hypothetical protein VGJ36_05365 [Gemmatimonadales bacterium]